MIPAFAMERTQELLYEFHQLFKSHEIPEVRVFLDSPLAIKLTKVYESYTDYFNKEMQEVSRRSNGNIFDFPELTMTAATEESKSINGVKPPKIIMAGSGMSHGGRILHHEVRYLPDPKSTILFVGYQAKGCIGRAILEGAKTVKIFGEEVPVNCHKVEIGGYSAHADQPRLLEWVSSMKGSAKEVFVVQGEEASSEALAAKINSDLGMHAVVPTPMESVEL
jgi:metallo-beta-lactamase family protein